MQCGALSLRRRQLRWRAGETAMALEPNGTWDGARTYEPGEWDIRRHMVAHHIIARERLCQFWNRLIEQRAAASNAMQLAYVEGAIVSYVQITGYRGGA